MDVFISLFDNTIAFIAMILLALFWTTKSMNKNIYYKYIIGLVFSAMAVFIMINSVHVGNGLYIDARYAIPVIAIIFFGPIPGIMVMLAIILMRVFYLGGAGASIGVTYVIVQVIVMYYYKVKYFDKHRGDSVQVKSLKLGLLTFFLQLILLSLPLAFLPSEIAFDAIKENAVYLLTIYPVIVYFFSLVVSSRQESSKKEQDALLRDQFFSTVLKRSLNPIGIVEKGGRILHLNDMWARQSGYDSSHYENISEWFDDTKGPLEKSAEEVKNELNQSGSLTYIVHTKDNKKVVWSIEQKEVKAPHNDEIYYVLIGKDVTTHLEYQETLLDMTYHDFLTGLYNRRYYNEIFKKNSDSLVDAFVLYGDMDDLKSINDFYGHFRGDEAIQLCTRILNKCFPKNSTIFRFGGDEFVVVAEHTTKEECIRKINLIDEELRKHDFGKINVGISLGLKRIHQDEPLETAIIKAESRMYEYKIFESSSVRSGAIEMILTMLFEKDSETERHSKRVQRICNVFADHAKLSSSESSLLSRAALMHDIGKILIPTDILLSVRKLSEQEREIINNHCFLGHRILARKAQFDQVAEIVLSHHEKMDGSGYPRNLVGDDIPYTARILHVADAFEAMTSVRPYAKMKSFDEAKAELISCSGTQFDKEIVQKFISVIDEIPEALQ